MSSRRTPLTVFALCSQKVAYWQTGIGKEISTKWSPAPFTAPALTNEASPRRPRRLSVPLQPGLFDNTCLPTCSSMDCRGGCRTTRALHLKRSPACAIAACACITTKEFLLQFELETLRNLREVESSKTLAC